MTHGANKPIPRLRKASQPPLSRAGAIPDSDRAKRPSLSDPSATGQELAARRHSLTEAVDAAKAGFDAVVFDLSRLPLEENVRQTREAVDPLKSINPSVPGRGGNR